MTNEQIEKLKDICKSVIDANTSVNREKFDWAITPDVVLELIAMLEAVRSEERERCAKVALGEHLGNDVIDVADKAYNTAIKHVVSAIREGATND